LEKKLGLLEGLEKVRAEVLLALNAEFVNYKKRAELST